MEITPVRDLGGRPEFFPQLREPTTFLKENRPAVFRHLPIETQRFLILSTRVFFQLEDRAAATFGQKIGSEHAFFHPGLAKLADAVSFLTDPKAKLTPQIRDGRFLKTLAYPGDPSGKRVYSIALNNRATLSIFPSPTAIYFKDDQRKVVAGGIAGMMPAEAKQFLSEKGLDSALISERTNGGIIFHQYFSIECGEWAYHVFLVNDKLLFNLAYRGKKPEMNLDFNHGEFFDILPTGYKHSKVDEKDFPEILSAMAKRKPQRPFRPNAQRSFERFCLSIIDHLRTVENADPDKEIRV